mgnify:CR=1 FL=1
MARNTMMWQLTRIKFKQKIYMEIQLVFKIFFKIQDFRILDSTLSSHASPVHNHKNISKIFLTQAQSHRLKHASINLY